MKTNKILDIIFDIGLVMALVELVFLYVWFETATPEVSTGAATSTITRLSVKEAEASSSGKTVIASPDESVTNVLEKDKAPVPHETKNTFSVPAAPTTNIALTRSSSNTSDDGEGRNAHSPEDLAYQAAAATAIWPDVPRPDPIHGVPVLYPKLRHICSCESSYSGTWYDAPRQYENGHVLMNYGGNDDVGMCQINISQFGIIAASLGDDIYTPTGNINFANWLFEREGSAPWFKSKHCWKHAFE